MFYKYRLFKRAFLDFNKWQTQNNFSGKMKIPLETAPLVGRIPSIKNVESRGLIITRSYKPAGSLEHVKTSGLEFSYYIVKYINFKLY